MSGAPGPAAHHRSSAGGILAPLSTRPVPPVIFPLNPHPPPMRDIRFAAVAAALLAGAPACVNPRAQANMAQAVMEMGTAVQNVQQDLQTTQATVDSLRAVVAYQDTLIQRLATLTQVPWPPPRH